MSEKQLNEELVAIEAALGSLTPVPSSVSRDRMMFLAGQASAGRALPFRGGPRAAWLWPCTTAVSLLAAAVFGVLWSTSDNPSVVERVVYVPAARASSPLQASATKSPKSPSSSSFAKWQVAPATRKKAAEAKPGPSATPTQRSPRNSGNGNRSHATDRVT